MLRTSYKFGLEDVKIKNFLFFPLKLKMRVEEQPLISLVFNNRGNINNNFANYSVLFDVTLNPYRNNSLPKLLLLAALL